MAVRSAFLKDLLARIPAEHRSAVEAGLDVEEVQTFADQAALRQADYSRNMDQLRTSQQAVEDIARQQTEWYDANKAALEAARSTTGTTPTIPTLPAPTTAVPPDFVRVADVEKMLAERERGAVAFITVTNQMQAEHARRFNEVLDISALASDPEVGKLGLQGVYQKQFGEKLNALAQTAETARINQLVEARMAEERKKFGSTPPYPVPGSEVSPLDVLNQTTPDPTQFSAEAAADEYMRLASARG